MCLPLLSESCLVFTRINSKPVCLAGSELNSDIYVLPLSLFFLSFLSKKILFSDELIGPLI